MKYFLIIILCFLTGSCQFFETEKISTDTFYEEEMKLINWNEVDQYPAFLNCEHHTEREDQKACFELTLTNHLYAILNARKISSINDLNETVQLNLEVSNTAILTMVDIKMDSVVINLVPDLREKLKEGIDSLQPVAPAYKRGIPVKTAFTLPIVLKTRDL